MSIRRIGFHLACILQDHPTGISINLGCSPHEDGTCFPGNRAGYSLYGLSSSLPCNRNYAQFLAAAKW